MAGVPNNGVRIYDDDGNLLGVSAKPLVISGTVTTSGSATSTDLEGGGKVAVGTTAVEATFTGTSTTIVITADKDNTGVLYVGKSNVASNGANSMVQLESGDVLTLDYNDTTNALYVVASESSQNFWKGAIL
jgi:hypothetical protein